MKNLTLAILATIFLAGTAWAGDYTIRPRAPDFTPGDGFMDKGSYSNPYIIEDSHGREVGTIRPRCPDLIPGDGFMEEGSFANPYEIE